MTDFTAQDFTGQDLAGSSFRRVNLSGSRFREVHLTEALLHDVDLSGTRVRAAYLDGVRMTGVEVPDLEIYGELGRLVVNGVDVVPLVEGGAYVAVPRHAVHDRGLVPRQVERVPRRPVGQHDTTDPAGVREAEVAQCLDE